jgi:hypothetical protein
MDEPISLRKLAANRRNALRSTGPRRAAEKAKSSRNALKDGLFANKFLIGDGDAPEDRNAYEELHRELLAEYQPDGVVDRLNVRLLCDEVWRLLNRVAPAEQGAIRKRADDWVAAERERRRQQFEDDREMDSANLKCTSLGLQFLINELDNILTEVQRLDVTGMLHLPLEQLPKCLAQDLEPLQQALAAQDPQDREAFVMRALRRQRATLTRDLQSAREREDLDLQATRARFRLPGPTEMEHILRAKTAAERRIDRLQIQLQPLKHARAAADRAAMRPRAIAP